MLSPRRGPFAAQVELIAAAVRRVLARLPSDPSIVLAGEGAFLALEVIYGLQLSSNVISLTERLGPTVSRCGPAHALAVLAREDDLR